jgi:hypothetical protein
MRRLKPRLVVLACLIAGCGDDSFVPDAGQVDAASLDAPVDGGSLRPDGSFIGEDCYRNDPACSAEGRFCCYVCLECSDGCSTVDLGACMESPPDGSETDCDPADPTACPVSSPVCCRLPSARTFCVEQVLAGPDWNCSI